MVCSKFGDVAVELDFACFVPVGGLGTFGGLKQGE